MSTQEVAKKVVELVRKQAWYEALDTLYDDNVVSVEAYSMGGDSPETRGKEGVRGKIDWWVDAMEVHSFDAHGPFVGHDRFVVQYDADVTDKKTKERRQLSEVGVYTVKDGKIVREEFLPRAVIALATAPRAGNEHHPAQPKDKDSSIARWISCCVPGLVRGANFRSMATTSP